MRPSWNEEINLVEAIYYASSAGSVYHPKLLLYKSIIRKKLCLPKNIHDILSFAKFVYAFVVLKILF